MNQNQHFLATGAAGAMAYNTWFQDAMHGAQEVMALIVTLLTLMWWIRIWIKKPDISPPPVPPRDAADAKVKPRRTPTLTAVLLAFLAAGGAGCARFSTQQTDLSYENGKPARQITTRASSYTLFTSKSQLANFKASQTDKTQSANVGSLSQESTEPAAVIKALTDFLNAAKTPTPK